MRVQIPPSALTPREDGEFSFKEPGNSSQTFKKQSVRRRIAGRKSPSPVDVGKDPSGDLKGQFVVNV
jgi:hypothetical protein